MNRAVLAADRAAAAVVAAVLIAGGVAAFLWWRGTAPLAGPLDTGPVMDQTSQPWWPWAVGLLGALLLAAGVRWLLAHAAVRRVGSLRLPGDASHGRLSADARSVASVAADVLAQAPGIRSTRGTTTSEHGRVVVKVVATLEPHAHLPEVAEAADAVSSDLKRVLGRDDVRCLVRLTVARRAQQPSHTTWAQRPSTTR